MKRSGAGISAIGALLLSGAVLAQDIPIRNWDVPRDGLSKSFVEFPTLFAAVTPPCRLTDSRVSSGGPGPIPASGTRVYDFFPAGSPSCGTLPGNIFPIAVSVFLTVVNPSGPGFLYSFPPGNPPASPTSIVNYNAGELRNAAAIIPVNPSTGAFTLGVGGAGTDVIIDINGIFHANDQFSISANVPGGQVLLVTNFSAFSPVGIHAYADGINGSSVLGRMGPSGDLPSSGVRGWNQGSGAGVRGIADDSGPGVAGTSELGVGISGVSNQGFAGVSGSAVLGSGVYGTTPNTGSGAAGVQGIAGTEYTVNTVPHAGVKGLTRTGAGVLGVADNLSGRGTSGYMVNSGGGAALASGHLGVSATTGVFSNGDIMATGPKFFVEPHPTDASRMIRFVSLEGNEAGTYFRGKAKFESGLARIAVPEDFRIVTDPEGLSIQIQPIGEMASTAVVRIGLDEIVVKASRNVEFFYTVNGVRKAYKDVSTIVANDFVFVPERPDQPMPLWLSEEAKARLIRNGTYNADGTVNLDTSKRLGWDKAWAKEKR